MLLRRPPNLAFGAGIAIFALTVVFYLFTPSIFTSSAYPYEDTQASIELANELSLPDLPAAYSAHYPSLTLPAELASYPELYQRLHAFLSRPIYSHQEAIDLGINSAGCPYKLSDRLVNPDQLNGDGGFWEKDVEPEVIVEKRVEMVNYLVKVLTEEKREIVGAHGDAPRRGIVITGGNADTTRRVITLLKILRNHHGCTLPVEVFHFPGEMESEDERKEIEGLDAVIKEITDTEKDTGAWKSFNIKGLSITHSTFQELIYLDSDNVPLRDPSFLFDSKRYNAEGSGKAVFYPDLSKDHTDNAVWRLIGEPCTLDLWTFESGQIIIDKAGNNGLNLAALHLAAYMQANHPFWFHLCGGDKDTFRWGFRALDLAFTTSPRWLSPLGSLNRMESGRLCGHTILQYDLDIPEGADREPPLFVHSNLLKHISGLHQGNTFTHLKRAAVDNYSEPSLNYAHQWVRWANNRGMCTDVEFWDDGAQLTEEQREVQSVMTIPLDDFPEFEGFESYFFAEGGRAGGW